jgi:hypothetical protein
LSRVRACPGARAGVPGCACPDACACACACACAWICSQLVPEDEAINPTAAAEDELTSTRTPTLAEKLPTISKKAAAANDPRARDPPSQLFPKAGSFQIDVEGPSSRAAAPPHAPSSPGVLARVKTTLHLEAELTAAEVLAKDTARQLQRDFQLIGERDFDFGPAWKFKTFVLFPRLAQLSQSDHLARVWFPVAFTVYVLVMLSQVGFLSGHYALLATSPCYNLAIASSGAS